MHLAFEHGLLMLGCGTSVIRLAPPLVVTRAEVEEALAILDHALTLAEDECCSVSGAACPRSGGRSFERRSCNQGRHDRCSNLAGIDLGCQDVLRSFRDVGLAGSSSSAMLNRNAAPLIARHAPRATQHRHPSRSGQPSVVHCSDEMGSDPEAARSTYSRARRCRSATLMTSAMHYLLTTHSATCAT